ncbi:MAG: hypothetical protein MMC23_003365 [Stictis urceolatum]|nr:hypothetical protein [Stictis urceolata]
MKNAITSIPFVASLVFGLSSACSTVSNSQVTFYGYPDNDPPGADTAHDCGGRNYQAGGLGTYDDPLTFATAPGEFDVCEIVYLPLLKKYLRYEDDCAQCESDWDNGQYHIDIWTGSSTDDGGQNQIDCEDQLTSGGNYDIIRQPGSDYEVDQAALYDGSCHPENVFEDNKASNYC